MCYYLYLKNFLFEMCPSSRHREGLRTLFQRNVINSRDHHTDSSAVKMMKRFKLHQGELISVKGPQQFSGWVLLRRDGKWEESLRWFPNLMGPCYPDGLEPLHNHHPTQLAPVKPSPLPLPEQTLTQPGKEQRSLSVLSTQNKGELMGLDEWRWGKNVGCKAGTGYLKL